MKKLIGMMLLCCILLSLSSIIQAQFGFPCEFDPPQSYFRPPTHRHLRVNFHKTDQLLTIIDRQTRKIYRTLATGIDGFSYAGWSPSCRYVAGNVYSDGVYTFTIWDVETGERIVHLGKKGSLLQWSPDEHYLVARSSNENYRVADMIVNMSNNSYSLHTWFGNIVWDTASDRLYAIHRRELDAVHAYELSTGRHIAIYAPENQADRLFIQELFLSDDHSHLVYYTSYTDALHIDANLTRTFDGCRGGFAVYNVNTLSGQLVHTDCRKFPISYQDGRPRLALSPDNRYVVAGLDVIRVWDLQSLNPDSSPNRIFAGPDYQTAHIRFLNNQTIETFAAREYRYGLRWDLSTGEYVNTFDYQLNTVVNRDGSLING